MSFVESVARTNRLYCSNCGDKIEKGNDVIFELNETGKMENVFGEKCNCKKGYIEYANDDEDDNDLHPFSGDGLGQD